VVLFVWQHLHYRRKKKQDDYEYRPVKSETWIKAREKKRRGEFQRKVARRVAISLDCDMFELECGRPWPAVGEQKDLRVREVSRRLGQGAAKMSRPPHPTRQKDRVRSHNRYRRVLGGRRRLYAQDL
jgi:hypothetical protein